MNDDEKAFVGKYVAGLVARSKRMLLDGTFVADIERITGKPYPGKITMSGRPNEGRVKVTWYVLPQTAKRIVFLVDRSDKAANTPGKVVDSLVGVNEAEIAAFLKEHDQAGSNVAGAGRKAPRGQHGRAKRSSSRAKRANGALSGQRRVDQ